MRFTDATVLREQAYAGPAMLADRASLYHWQQPRIDLPALAVRALGGLPAGAVVGDLGCGRGQYLEALGASDRLQRRVGLDLSELMLAALDPALADRAAGSLDRLPLGTGVLDGALVMHVLYHLPEPDRALAEVRRVLRPGGVAVFSSNDDSSPDGLWSAFRAAGLDRDPVTAHWSLSGASAAVRAAGFTYVRLQAFDYTLAVPTAEPVLRYFDSCRPTMGETPQREWDLIRQRLQDRVADDIGRDGEFRVTGRTGLVIAG